MPSIDARAASASGRYGWRLTLLASTQRRDFKGPMGAEQRAPRQVLSRFDATPGAQTKTAALFASAAVF
ncbi:hypothetical protein BURKHO8Y_190093 [Burkholderia sp. 8Y]|nr:hypothetical protein BURKHO8Y_190093 [Burkholderia sp. 8Y]